MKRVYKMIFGRFGQRPQEIFFASLRKMRRYWRGIISYPRDAGRIDYCHVLSLTAEADGVMHAATEYAISDEFEAMLAKAKGEAEAAQDKQH